MFTYKWNIYLIKKECIYRGYDAFILEMQNDDNDDDGTLHKMYKWILCN